MTHERIMMFVERTLECRKQFPEIAVGFLIECNSEELYASVNENEFFWFSTNSFLETKDRGNIKQFHDPDLMMGELFLNDLMMGQTNEAIERATKYAEICRTSAAGAV